MLCESFTFFSPPHIFFSEVSFLRVPQKKGKANAVSEKLVCKKNKLQIQNKEAKMSW